MQGVYLQKNSPYYWIRYYDKYEPRENRKRKSINTKIEVTASDRKRHEEKQRLSGTPGLRSLLKKFKSAIASRNIEITSGIKLQNQVLLSSLVTEYITENPNLRPESQNLYKYAAQKLINASKDKPIHKYSKQDYSLFVQNMIKNSTNETTQSTISKHLSVLFNFAVKKRYVNESIIKLLKAPPGIPEPIPSNDLKTILNFYKNKHKELKVNKVNFDADDIFNQKLFVYLMHYTGMRQSSIFGLDWSNFDFENRIMNVSNVKGRKNFYFPIHNKLYSLLNPIKKNTGKIIQRKDRRLSFWDRDLKKLVKAGKIKKKYQMYQLRDTFSTMLASSRVDVSVIQDLLNHSNINITKNSYLLSDAERNRLLLNRVKFL